MSTKYNNLYAQKVYDIIFPLLGDIMTQNVIKFQTKKIGKDEETLLESDLPKLAEALKSGLNIFIGSEGSNSIADKILKIS